MTEELQALCETFIESRERIKKVFKWEDSAMSAACAPVFMNRGIVPEESSLKEAERLIKNSTGAFSDFRGNVKVPVVSMLAVSDKPEEKMKRILAANKALGKQFHSSEYRALTSAILADLADEAQYEQIAEKGKGIYKRMRGEHPFLTSAEDSVFAVLLALSGQGEEALVSDMEACYETLKRDFSTGNACQSLSQVLALSELTAEEKCGRVCGIYYGLKDAGAKYGTNFELATLGCLALLPADVEVIVEEMLEVNEFLGKQKGYGGMLGLDKKTRLMHSSMIVSRLHNEDNSGAEAAALTSALSLVVAQEVAMCAVIMAATTAATVSNNS